MTTYAELLAFVKLKRRLPTADTQYDNEIKDSINSSYRRYVRKFQKDFAPGMRGTANITMLADTQDYNLASDFDRLIEDSVRYYTSGDDDYIIIPIVSGPDAEIWEAFPEQTRPGACRVVAGSTGTQRKLRLLPAFSESGKIVTYAYWKRPATLTGAGVMELPELADAVAWDAVASSYDYFRDANGVEAQAMALDRARAAYRDARQTLNQ